jgi:hypothetical protein
LVDEHVLNETVVKSWQLKLSHILKRKRPEKECYLKPSTHISSGGSVARREPWIYSNGKQDDKSLFFLYGEVG